MAKAVGSKKTGGRKKGTPNKKLYTIVESLELKGIDLITEILNEAESLVGLAKINAYQSLLPYIYPKRKPTEDPPFSIDSYIENLNLEGKRELYCKAVRSAGDDLKPQDQSIERLKDQVILLEKIIRMKEENEELKMLDDC